MPRSERGSHRALSSLQNEGRWEGRRSSIILRPRRASKRLIRIVRDRWFVPFRRRAGRMPAVLILCVAEIFSAGQQGRLHIDDAAWDVGEAQGLGTHWSAVQENLEKG